ncbi:MAG: response regulator [Lachnospiraceae bacterium]|nr:response regulator [Lachnospiraceae bacterium]
MISEENIGITRHKILIVDDKAVNRYILGSIFEDDYEIIECCDGRCAIEELAKDKDSVAVILLDIVMPTLDGFAVLNFMKEKGMIDIPVVLVSSNVNDENIRKAYLYDVADYIQKPFQENVVRQRVKYVIRKYGKIRERYS